MHGNLVRGDWPRVYDKDCKSVQGRRGDILDNVLVSISHMITVSSRLAPGPWRVGGSYSL